MTLVGRKVGIDETMDLLLEGGNAREEAQTEI